MPQEPMPGQGQEPPINEAMQGMMKSVEADSQAADMIEQMGQKEAADMLRQSAQLKAQALELLTQGSKGQGQMQSPDTAGTQAQPVTMQTRG